ncbi:MAG: vWA domain-containing protein [Bacteroidia bacterium]
MISIKTLLNNPYFLKNGETKSVYLYVELLAGEVTTTQKRLPLNIALVLDRSGSMGGDKMTYTKKAADFVIDQLDSEDILSIVQYDDKIEVVQAAEKVKNKALLHKKVEAIEARSMTNLSGGILEGYHQVSKNKKEGLVNRVLLLSDGLANEGITDVSQLQTLVQKKFRESGIALSTFGVGADYDEKLMTNLSEYGGANYYFIDSPDKIPSIFAKELEGLLQVVGQNASLKVKFPKQFAHPSKVYGYPFSVENEVLTVNFNDIYSKEEKAILIRFDITQSFDHDLQFDYQVSYDDVHVSMDRITNQGNLYLKPITDKEVYLAAENTEIKEHIALFVSNDEFERILEMVDRRDFVNAKAAISTLLSEVNSVVNEETSEKLKAQKEIMEKYEQNMDFMEMERGESFAMSQKMSKSANYMSRKRK